MITGSGNDLGFGPAAPADDQASVREGLVLLLGGLPDIEVVGAGPLFLSNHTVKTHISRIFAKTGSRDRAAAIGHAHRHNIGGP